MLYAAKKHCSDLVAQRSPAGQSTCNEAAYGAGRTANQCIKGKRICGATSSSTVGWGGEPDRALDQTTHGAWNQMSCTHTDAGDSNARNIDGSAHGPAWWQVDLGTCSICSLLAASRLYQQLAPTWQVSQALSSMWICGTARIAAKTDWNKLVFTSPIHPSEQQSHFRMFRTLCFLHCLCYTMLPWLCH